MAADALAEHRKRMLAEGNYAPDKPVFCDSEGGWLRKSNVQRWHFNPILKRSGVARLRFHDLRHSAASLLLLRGEDLKVISSRLGHTSISTTADTYMHVLPSLGKQAAATMDGLLRQAAEGGG